MPSPWPTSRHGTELPSRVSSTWHEVWDIDLTIPVTLRQRLLPVLERPTEKTHWALNTYLVPSDLKA